MSVTDSLRALIGSRGLKTLWICAIIIALLLTLLPQPEQTPRFAHADKLFHCGYFLLLGILAALSQHGHIAARHAAWSMVGLGIAIELIQWLLPWRSFELLDVLADSVGVALGYVVSLRIRLLL